MINLTGLKGFCLVFCVLVAFVTGWTVNGWRYDAKWAEFEAEANKAALDKVQQARAVETSWRDLADLVSSDLKGDYAEIETKYEAALKRLDLLNAELNRMRTDRAGRAGGAEQMPAASEPPSRACKPCKCGSSAEDGGGVAQALTIARDCDRLAVRYNALLQFYSTIKKYFKDGQD